MTSQWQLSSDSHLTLRLTHLMKQGYVSFCIFRSALTPFCTRAQSMILLIIYKHNNILTAFKCFFVGGNSDEASIVSFSGEEVAENGRFQPALVDRSLDGEYTCSLGSAEQIIQIDVFRSEDNAFVNAANDKPSQLTVATLDVDFSSELPFFDDYFGKLLCIIF